MILHLEEDSWRGHESRSLRSLTICTLYALFSRLMDSDLTADQTARESHLLSFVDLDAAVLLRNK